MLADELDTVTVGWINSNLVFPRAAVYLDTITGGETAEV